MTGLSLALANLKPGTGKTTSAVWLAHVFAQAGNSVLLVDADPSGSALEWSDLAAMYPGLPPQAAFPFRIVALPSREIHRRIPEIAQADDVVIIDAPQLEDHAAIAAFHRVQREHHVPDHQPATRLQHAHGLAEGAVLVGAAKLVQAVVRHHQIGDPVDERKAHGGGEDRLDVVELCTASLHAKVLDHRG